jgi:DNA helicase-2/ATP-dependent DNA helicase PcrA
LRNASGLARPRLQASLALLRAGDLPAWAAGLMGALEPERLAGAVLVRREDIRQVRDHLEQLLQLALGEEQDLDGFFALLHSLERAHAPRAAGAAGRVSLSTIAAAKGLEFDHVLLPHLSRGEFVGEGSADENRNLLYVALTRARQRLSLAFNPQTPSRYLIDAGLIEG